MSLLKKNVVLAVVAVIAKDISTVSGEKVSRSVCERQENKNTHSDKLSDKRHALHDCPFETTDYVDQSTSCTNDSILGNRKLLRLLLAS